MAGEFVQVQNCMCQLCGWKSYVRHGLACLFCRNVSPDAMHVTQQPCERLQPACRSPPGIVHRPLLQPEVSCYSPEVR